MDLQALFPTGIYSDNQQKFMVKDSAYFWPVAEFTEGSWRITPFGAQISAQKPSEKPPAKQASARKLGTFAPTLQPEFAGPTKDDVDKFSFD